MLEYILSSYGVWEVRWEMGPRSVFLLQFLFEALVLSTWKWVLGGIVQSAYWSECMGLGGFAPHLPFLLASLFLDGQIPQQGNLATVAFTATSSSCCYFRIVVATSKRRSIMQRSSSRNGGCI